MRSRAVADFVPDIMVSAKVRIRFRKAGDLRLISHHDLMRCWERMLRRAALPFHSTAGFNPKPRLVFLLSLGLGIDGRREVAELELDEPIPPEEVHQRLRQQAPPGLDILEVRSVAANTRGQVKRVTYRIDIPSDRAADLPARTAELLAAEHCWIDRTRPQPRRYDLRPYLDGLRTIDDITPPPNPLPEAERGGKDNPSPQPPPRSGEGERTVPAPLSGWGRGEASNHQVSLEMDLWVTPTGTARADEVLGLLGLGDLLAAGAVLARTTVELHDEAVPLPGDPLLSGVGAPAASSAETDPDDRFAPQKGNA